jgi:hypothetical protein
MHYIQLEISCANPYNLDLTAFIDTAAMLMLLTSKAPASPNTHANLGISMMQSGGTSMSTAQAMQWTYCFRNYHLTRAWPTVFLDLSTTSSPLQSFVMLLDLPNTYVLWEATYLALSKLLVIREFKISMWKVCNQRFASETKADYS